MESLYGCPPPDLSMRSVDHGLPYDALITWLDLFQKRKYLFDLRLEPDSLCGLTVLDIGSGPFPNLTAFRNCERYGIDPLIYEYYRAGFPIGDWSVDYTYLCAAAEHMPFHDNSFDAVISVNAIDHVDDFAAVATEIRRVSRPGALFRMHTHYHEATATEPVELNDSIFLSHYAWVPGIRKIDESTTKDCGFTRAPSKELYVLWGNT